jgi:hypothetical protein
MAAVAAFLAMAERENLILNGVRGSEALEAFARMCGLPAFKLRTLARDPTVDRIIKDATAPSRGA